MKERKETINCTPCVQRKKEVREQIYNGTLEFIVIDTRMGTRVATGVPINHRMVYLSYTSVLESIPRILNYSFD